LQWRQEASPPPPKTVHFRSEAEPPVSRRRSTPRRLEGALWIFVIAVITTALLIARKAPLPFARRAPSPKTLQNSKPPQSSNRQSEIPLLDALRKHVDEFRALDPEALRCSDSFAVARAIPVTSANAANGKRVADAFSSLIETRELLIKPSGAPKSGPVRGYVAYYFDEDGKNAKEPIKLDRIARILKDHPPDLGDCRVLEEAFAFEFDHRGSAVERWCTSVAGLEKTYQRLLRTTRPPEPSNASHRPLRLHPVPPIPVRTVERPFQHRTGLLPWHGHPPSRGRVLPMFPVCSVTYVPGLYLHSSRPGQSR